MSDLITYQLDDGVATLVMCSGKVNALSPALLEAFNQCLDRAEQDKAVVVVTGQPGVFCGGYDLKVMGSGPEQAINLVAAGSTLARRMLAHPFPIVAACSGHAIAKGALLLLAADYRLGAEGPFQVGLNEVLIGMTMHHAGIALARDRLTAAGLQRAVNNAEMFNPAQALQVGFFDQLASPDTLLAEAHTVARKLATLNMPAHAATKRKVRSPLLDALAQAIALDRKHLLMA
ncbi:crotonase/enoyl-CoA hydratase family protein [Pseudomonas typographi]|uniref:Crotonase/enoyl-CoA hydratase family protein n=1 Tax=Pseudomonas typographi TaxID=2715964 RepID=A0ABR7YZP3_9PSED|nr:crotonase/enoyl-CoA hydratase family protein [Pseudomonas typographi]MBD1550610.1 crotonase/enoyl-CoA hydratase family protein [Pseudomonas typographi]MBD1586805.1 crotonase/enoyl-CoA hydratase family protein [Pseudomonas typographi]MBD1598699.1 crotonase/enoyl-CoA hydratase family protein [Pseudomonas typographi]